MTSTRIITAYDRYGVLGELTGKDSSQLDQFFRQAHQDGEQALEDARLRAREGQAEIRLDGSRLSGVHGADSWIVNPAGKATRELEKFPSVEAQLLSPPNQNEVPRPCTDIERARPLLARCAFNGLWSPSGTNWQPIRTMELSADEMTGISPQTSRGCGLVVLARRRYQSILGDIAGLCGIQQHSHTEHIDLGIWLCVAKQTAHSHGWALQYLHIQADHQTKTAEGLKQILAARLAEAQGRAACTAGNLLASLEDNDHYPACILVPCEGQALKLDAHQAGGLQASGFDRLVTARSTQRVASPERTLPREILTDLFSQAQAATHPEQEQDITCPVFSWHDDFPVQVGRAMLAGIDGPDGLVARTDLAHLKAYLLTCGGLGGDMQAWSCQEDGQLEESGKKIGLPADLVPAHICAKLEEGGHFRREHKLLVDRRGRPLSPVRLMKLVRMMSKSFGKYFLSFQNTHPLTGVLLAPQRDGDMSPLHQTIGKTVAHMTLLARARGLVSIIKSGPIELAGDSIGKLLVDGAHARPEQTPVLTFQVGLPLGPDDTVAKGQPGEHSGLKERLLDRRAGRSPLQDHYLPAN